MKKIIIFGASGNVGSYVTKYFTEFFNREEFEIIASGRRDTSAFCQFGIDYISVDLSRAIDFEKLPQNDVYAVVYLAAQIPSYMNDYNPELYVNSNILGAFNVLEYCRKVKADRIIFSTTVFDVSLYTKDNPSFVLKPDLPYNFDYSGDHAVYVITKNTAIELMKHYYKEYGLKYFIFRFPTIYSYSPYHYYYPNGVKTLRPVYSMIDKAQKGEPIELWGDPNYSKDMVYVDDCAQMLAKCILVNKEFGWYNVGTGIPVTLKEQIQTIIEVFSPAGKESKIVYRKDKKAGGGFLMDISNAKEDLGYEPQFTCRKLFEEYKKEMQLNRFIELRGQ